MTDNFINAFPISGYHGADYFCNRKDDVTKLSKALKSHRHTVLYSIRRLGKTALIHHVLETAIPKTYLKIYCDILSTINRRELMEVLTTATLRVTKENTSWGRNIIAFIKSLRPVISYNELTDHPEVSLTSATPAQEQSTIHQLMDLLNSQGKRVIFVIDEFQRITDYPEKNMEATLRTIFQSLNNVTFLFSGSQQHLLTEMFGSAKRPFFAMTQMLKLKKISNDEYGAFISEKFAEAKVKVDAEAIDFILSFSRTHTYYTQLLCNHLYDNITSRRITLDDVKATAFLMLKEQEPVYYSYRSLLTNQQWRLLTAIAREQILTEPTASWFLEKYSLGGASSVKRSLDALLSKEMIFAETNEAGKLNYHVYDVFLSRWMEQVYKNGS